MKKLTLLLVFLVAFFSCNQQEIAKQSDDFIPINNAKAKIATDDKYTRGIYVDDFVNIVGTEEEDYLLKWCQVNNFNRVNLYNINSMTTNNQLVDLEQFIYKAKNYYNISVSIITSELTSISNATSYYNSNLYATKMDAVTTEYEFWNSGYNFNAFLNLSSQVNNLNLISLNTVKKEAYIGQIQDNLNLYSQNQVALNLVKRFNKILLVNYVNNAQNYNSTFQNKLQLLANSAASLNTTIKIEVLFNVNTSSSDPNIYNYFDVNAQNHNFVDAYINFMTGYNLAVFPNKNRIDITGYHVYRYSNAKLARPLF